MPFARPTLAELIDRVRGDLRDRLEIGGLLLRRAMVDVLGAVWAGAVHTLYGYLEWLSRLLFGDHDDDDVLLKKASLYGIMPNPTMFATGNVAITGEDGSAVLADEVLQLDANTTYTVTTGATIASGTGTIVVTAVLSFRRRQQPIVHLPGRRRRRRVQAALNTQGPIAVVPTTMAPTGFPVAFTIHVVPDTGDTRAAITAELTKFPRCKASEIWPDSGFRIPANCPNFGRISGQEHATRQLRSGDTSSSSSDSRSLPLLSLPRSLL